MLVPSYFGDGLCEGMHGYSPRDETTYGVFLSNVKPGEKVRSILDIRKEIRSWLNENR
jgi:hypothetical protein